MYRDREQARRTECPFAKNGFLAAPSEAELGPEAKMCSAEDCMMWREAREFEGRNIHPVGWCGLAEEPRG